MKRMMLIFAGGLAAALMMLLLSGSLGSGSGHAQTPTATATATPIPPHYKCYEVTGSAPGPAVDLATQFGLEGDVVVGAPTRLCLAALKNGEGSLTVPDVECFSIAGPPSGRIVNLLTQFGAKTGVQVGAPKEVCVPVTKAVAPAPAPSPVPTVPHYKCYDIPGNAPGVPAVLLETQFGEEPGMLVGTPTRLCLPALKKVGQNWEGDLSAPHVECFGITGPPAAPIPPLNLRTQFGTTTNVPVEDPKELCVPVLKTVAPPTPGPSPTPRRGVGGVQDLPGAAGNADSGGSSLPYVAIAGAAVGLVVVLGAGGWYARRRWLS